MPDALTVHLNRDGPRSVETPQTFEASGDFDVVFENHGSALHTHVRLDPTLSEVARVRTPNRYVEEGLSRRVRVDVEPGERPVEGRLEVVTGYGSTTEYVSVILTDPEATDDRVAVDESLGEPQSVPGDAGVDPERILFLAFVGVAALLAVVVAVLSRDLLVTVGVLVVLVAAAAAGFSLVE